jgi:hypothetical protein
MREAGMKSRPPDEMLCMTAMPQNRKRNTPIMQLGMRIASFVNGCIRPPCDLTHDLVAANVIVLGLNHLHTQTFE